MVKSQLYDTPFVINWKEEQLREIKKWNKKPKVEVYVYRCSGKIDRGFRGAPVCYSVNSKVVGMFSARDENYGYIIPIELILENFQKEDQVLKPSAMINVTTNLYCWLNKGIVYDELKQNNEAIYCYDKAIEIDPNYDIIWNAKGWALLNLKKYNDGLNCFDKAIELNPKYAYAFNNKGYALYSLREFDKAIKYVDMSIEMNPSNVYTWRNRGLIMSELGRYSDVLASYEKVLEIDKDFADAWFDKGLLLKKLGKKEDSRC